MPVPKRKTSKSRRDMRQANKHLIPQSFDLCHQEQCEHPRLPHQVCAACGSYKGIQILKKRSPKKALVQQ